MSLDPEFIAELQKHFLGEIRSDRAARVLYSTDASIYQIEPMGVAFPKTPDDLQAALELAAKYKVPILPRGSGSSLAGQAIGEALILDCSRWMDKLLDIDPEARTATVEPGLVLSRLNAAAAKHGLVFGPDPASAERATLGGVIANNATGAHSILYGMTADHLVSADVILADGSSTTWGNVELSAIGNQPSAVLSAALKIREGFSGAIHKNYPRSWRNSAGYRLNYLLPWSPSAPEQWSDRWSLAPGHYPPVQSGAINLAPLLAGSEGTLAVIRQATLNLVPKPKHTILGVLAYDSIAEACDDVPRLLEFHPSAVELVPQLLVRLAKGVPAYAGLVEWVAGDPSALLAVEFSGDRPEVLKEAVRSLGPQVIVAESLAEQARVWSVRKVGLGIFDSRPAERRPVAFIEDCAIPAEQLGAFVREMDRILAAHGTYAAYYAHASAGCLHIRPMLDMKHKPGDLRSIAEAVLALTLRLGGSMSSEHGDGLARGEFLRQIYGAEVSEAMRLLKNAADPYNLLNPGKMLDAPPMDTNLRYGGSYRASAWKPELDFQRNNGLAAAIEQCNGQGVCRKDAGVMCPSFQATREEANSTRGRANLLRALIMFPSPFGASARKGRGGRGEGETAAFGALDLCLACKGCKAECPSGVDMAKLKYEFQHEYYKTHRRKLRDYLFAYIGPLAQIGAPFGGLANWAMSVPFVKLALGLTQKRGFPQFAPRSAKSKFRFSNPEYQETVLLLCDTFSHFFEPEIEQAALDLLAASGIRVILLPYFGAGRTLISKGFIEPARRHAKRLLEAIRRLDPDGLYPVVGIEPSELYTLRDEFFDLLPGHHEEVERLAARAWLVEEYLVRPANDKKASALRITTSSLDKLPKKSKILLHGHCYQKAQPPAADGFPVGQFASAELLRAVGYEVEIVPSGCCGMAGAFGYEAEHYGVSMQVGELVLLPAVRRASERGDRIAAVGTSCRSQIADGANIEAQHPLVLVANLVK